MNCCQYLYDDFDDYWYVGGDLVVWFDVGMLYCGGVVQDFGVQVVKGVVCFVVEFGQVDEIFMIGVFVLSVVFEVVVDEIEFVVDELFGLFVVF